MYVFMIRKLCQAKLVLKHRSTDCPKSRATNKEKKTLKVDCLLSTLGVDFLLKRWVYPTLCPHRAGETWNWGSTLKMHRSTLRMIIVRSCFQRAPFPLTLKRKASVFEFVRFKELSRKALLSWQISVDGARDVHVSVTSITSPSARSALAHFKTNVTCSSCLKLASCARNIAFLCFFLSLYKRFTSRLRTSSWSFSRRTRDSMSLWSDVSKKKTVDIEVRGRLSRVSPEKQGKRSKRDS